MLIDIAKFAFKNRHLIHNIIAWRREIRAGLSLGFHVLSTAIRPKPQKINNDYIFVF